ncbi:MAG TPA: hypothetical protein VGG27_15030 [Magnetospirillaceae bacterium]|jgi:hypothetical protein
MHRFAIALAIVAPVVATAAAGIAFQDQLVVGFGSSGEQRALSDSNGLVWRDGAALHFRMATGAVLMLTDHIKCGALPCAGSLASQYRYLGWDPTAGGYKIQVGQSQPIDKVLPWDVPWDRPSLLDASQAPPRVNGPMAMPEAPPDVAPDVGMGDWLAQMAAGRDPIEGPRLAASNGHAVRKGSTLSFQLQSGQDLSLSDDMQCGQLVCPPEIERSYEYLGSSGDGRYQAVADHWYDGGDALLIDTQSGTVISLAGQPVFAPDGKRLAASMNDPETPGPHALEVWSLNGDAPSLDFSVKADAGQDAFDIVGWGDPNHLKLKRGAWDGQQRIPVMLAHDGESWHLEGGN